MACGVQMEELAGLTGMSESDTWWLLSRYAVFMVKPTWPLAWPTASYLLEMTDERVRDAFHPVELIIVEGVDGGWFIPVIDNGRVSEGVVYYERRLEPIQSLVGFVRGIRNIERVKGRVGVVKPICMNQKSPIISLQTRYKMCRVAAIEYLYPSRDVNRELVQICDDMISSSPNRMGPFWMSRTLGCESKCTIEYCEGDDLEERMSAVCIGSGEHFIPWGDLWVVWKDVLDCKMAMTFVAKRLITIQLGKGRCRLNEVYDMFYKTAMLACVKRAQAIVSSEMHEALDSRGITRENWKGRDLAIPSLFRGMLMAVSRESSSIYANLDTYEWQQDHIAYAPPCILNLRGVELTHPRRVHIIGTMVVMWRRVKDELINIQLKSLQLGSPTHPEQEERIGEIKTKIDGIRKAGETKLKMECRSRKSSGDRTLVCPWSVENKTRVSICIGEFGCASPSLPSTATIADVWKQRVATKTTVVPI